MKDLGDIGGVPLLILGFTCTGAANGIALLIRTAAGAMYPESRRARGISYVLFGSVFGMALGIVRVATVVMVGLGAVALYAMARDLGVAAGRRRPWT